MAIPLLIDWGTSRVRLWLVDQQGQPLDQIDADTGAGSLQGAAAFTAAFARLTGNWQRHLTGTALICGMAGKRGGWAEAAYLPLAQFPNFSDHLTWLETAHMQIAIVPGLRTADPADVMRGEETQLVGLLADQPDYNGLLCLPGTHSKWCRLRRGRLVSFRTCMTGELFALLVRHSVLRDALRSGCIDAAFRDGADQGLRNPALLDKLFAIRASWLLEDTDPIVGYSRLSGLLIGAEIASVIAPAERSTPVTLIGSKTLCNHYAMALTIAGMESRQLDGERLAMRGLQTIGRQINEHCHD